jgi:hypothetical protein
LLAPRLHDTVVPLGGGDHCPTFGDRQAERLFDVDVFARLASVDGGQGMPVIGRRDDNGVDVLAIEQPAIVAVAVTRAAGGLFDLGLGDSQVFFVDVANGHDLLDERREVLGAAAADADRADADLFVGRLGLRAGHGHPRGAG